MLLLIWDQDIRGVAAMLGIDCQKWKSTLDMVLNKQFSRDVNSKRSQNMGVKGRLLVIGMF
jgi:hypothetical protein